jgi:NAD(P)-dependent dehydrogenase (short-subunit alcohol dehydrogenase family)
MPFLKSGGCIVTLSFVGHQISDVDLDDPNFERTAYQPFLGYGRSKTANILYAVALDKRLKGRGIRATALHPGGSQTELSRHMTPENSARRSRSASHVEHYPVHASAPRPTAPRLPALSEPLRCRLTKGRGVTTQGTNRNEFCVAGTKLNSPDFNVKADTFAAL